MKFIHQMQQALLKIFEQEEGITGPRGVNVLLIPIWKSHMKGSFRGQICS